jgi:hypothetical protein
VRVGRMFERDGIWYEFLGVTGTNEMRVRRSGTLEESYLPIQATQEPILIDDEPKGRAAQPLLLAPRSRATKYTLSSAMRDIVVAHQAQVVVGCNCACRFRHFPADPALTVLARGASQRHWWILVECELCGARQAFGESDTPIQLRWQGAKYAIRAVQFRLRTVVQERNTKDPLPALVELILGRLDRPSPQIQNSHGTTRTSAVTQTPTPSCLRRAQNSQRKTCKACRGTGKQMCPFCHGRGYFGSKEFRCQKCKEHKYRRCITCCGLGYTS